MTQKEKEAKNSKKIEELMGIGQPFVEYYYTHTNNETMERYGIDGGTRILLKALQGCHYDPDYKKTHNVMAGRKSSRSHESYVQGGRKSGNTQKKSWASKSKDEMEAWSSLMSKTHGDDFKKRISKINKDYYVALPDDERKAMNKKKGDSCKRWWASLSTEEKDWLVRRNLEHGAGWNHDKISKTVQERYGVSNVAKLSSVQEKAKGTLNKTCLERYGVMWTCQLPQCNNAIGSKGSHTKPNEDFASLLEARGIQFCREFVIPGTKFRYDFKIGESLVEIDPTPWHNSTFSPSGNVKARDYHLCKTECAASHGMRCLHVFDWEDPAKVIGLLGKEESIGARKCSVREVGRNDAIKFISEHHLQGYARDSVRIGLYLDDELVSVMTFGKPRYNKNYEWEIIRYCSSKNVIGGAQRLFSHFVKMHNPSSIITYCDKSKFSGGTYERLGFSLLRSGRPSRHWYNMRTKEHYTDNLIRQQGFSRVVNHMDAKDDFQPTRDNDELMVSHGFVEVWDCGQDTYVWKRG